MRQYISIIANLLSHIGQSSNADMWRTDHPRGKLISIACAYVRALSQR